MRSTRHILLHLVLAATWLVSASAPLAGTDADFRRGDGDADGKLDLTDAVFVLLHLFKGGQSPPCLDAADANDDGALNLTDPVLVLNHLFQGAGPLAQPFEDCGWDPTGESLRCASYPACSPSTEVREAWVAVRESPTQPGPVVRIAVDLAGDVYVQTERLTLKYDAEGNEKWESPYPGGEGRASDLAVDDAGNVHVTGFSYDGRNSYIFTTVKYAADGKELWVVRDGPNGSPYDLAVDSAGNAYVTGVRFVTVKYDAGGKELWRAQYRFSDTSYEESQDLAVDSDGNVYVTGASDADGFSDSDYATVKYDSKGNQLWAARYDGPEDTDRDRASGLAVDGAGNVYVTGYSLLRPPKPSGAVIVKYGMDGSELWVAQRVGFEPRDMAVDCAGNLYFTGEAQDPESKVWAYTTVKYDTDGRELWVASYHRLNYFTHPNSLVLDHAGSVYVTGLSASGDEGSTEIVTVKYDSNGNRLWVAARQAPKCSLVFQHAANLAIDRAGNVYAWGGICTFNPVNTLQTIKYVQSGAPAQ